MFHLLLNLHFSLDARAKRDASRSASSNPLDPYWIAGFVSAEGSFGLNFTKDSRVRLGETLRPCFRVFQDARDLSRPKVF
jgi:hypothetical protein